MKTYLISFFGITSAILLTFAVILWTWGVDLSDVVRILTR